MSVNQTARDARRKGTERIRVGVSACLLGQNVRYDGGNKRNRFLLEELADRFEWVPVCPEVEIDLGTPRPTIQLEGTIANVRLIQPTGGIDLTDRMRTYAEGRVRELKDLEIDGYVLKSRSPSCGMERVPVWSDDGVPVDEGSGAFARVLIEHFPKLPVVEEGHLDNSALRKKFVERVCSHHRQRLLGLEPGIGGF